MVYPTLAILLVTAALGFGVGQRTPARRLGLGVATLSLLAALFVAYAVPFAPATLPFILLEFGPAKFSVNPSFAPAEQAIAVTLLGGSSAALFALAGAIAPTVRGFGSIFAWVLMALTAALLSLAAPPLSLFQPLAWAVVALSGYSALRASGVSALETPPFGLTLGLTASVLLAGCLAVANQPVAGGAWSGWLTTLCGLGAALALAGSPPLVGVQADADAAPAPLGALVYGLLAPATALGWLLRALPVLPPLPVGGTTAIGLFGALGVLACGAGAIGASRLRPLLVWATAGQAALVVTAAALTTTPAHILGPGLLVSLMLAATVGAGATATLERTTGSDDYTADGALPPRVAGVGWAIAAAASVGLPPLWGFWPRLWLLLAAEQQQPWLLAPLLAGAILLTLAMLLPLARFWGVGERAVPPRANWTDLLPMTLAGLLLLVFGVAPGLAEGMIGLPVALPTQIAVVGAGLLFFGLVILIGWATPSRQLAPDPDEVAVRLTPAALSAALRPVAWLGNPQSLLWALWAGLEQMSTALRFLMGLFEQRYYLLGMLAALVMIMLLMAQ